MGVEGWQAPIERTVTGLGYDLVDVERAARGLLRVTIDRVPGHVYPQAQGDGEHVTVDDCEAVTRQLQYVLEVENVDYARLEVSSPGLDRPLKKPGDYVRFVGHPVELTLRQAFGGRKHWKGMLQPVAEDGRWRLHVQAASPREAASELVFALDEVREARLVPVIDFRRGRGEAPRKAAKVEERS